MAVLQESTKVVHEITKSVYPTEDMGQLSILDMLTYFEQMGTMRVSDLHLKVGAPPTYRVDGEKAQRPGVDAGNGRAVDSPAFVAGEHR